MRARQVWSVLLLLQFAAGGPVGAAAPKGSLFIIGGGKRPEAMMRQFVDLAGGPSRAVILVLPMASADPETTGMDQAAQFRNLGVHEARYAVVSRGEAESAPPDRWLKGVTGVFFSGGDQSRLTAALLHTPFQQALLDLHARGGAIGGTSAGAAVMSAIMITGDERRRRDSTKYYATICADNVVTVQGFGFVTDMIIDQHFIRRKRHNRLISLVLEHPSLLGVGIDESTALVVLPEGRCTVTGTGSVLLFEASRADQIGTDSRGNLSARGVVMHLLTDGAEFDRETRTVLRSGR